MKRGEAIKTLNELLRETNDPWYEEVYNMAIEALSQPTLQDLTKPNKSEDRPTAVPCKDCFWFDQNIYRNCFRNRSEDEYAEWGVCTKLSHNMKVNDYCSCGEREAPYKGGDTE